mgnify:CR=1 FL=1
MQYPIKSDDPEGKKIYICINCSEDLGFVAKKYCPQCSTAEGRRKMVEENEIIKKELNVKLHA